MTVASLVLHRHFKASPERVFAAFTEKALMQGWYGPEAMTVPHCEVDARVGGKFRIEMHAATGSVNIVTGEFREITPPERLVFSWGWLNGAGRNPETLVTLTLNGGTFSTGGNTATASAVNGIATFSNLVINAVGFYTLTASDGGETVFGRNGAYFSAL